MHYLLLKLKKERKKRDGVSVCIGLEMGKTRHRGRLGNMVDNQSPDQAGRRGRIIVWTVAKSGSDEVRSEARSGYRRLRSDGAVVSG